MKHLATLLTMAITLTGLGQQMPYNPDANGDDFVGVDDVLGVLGVYDTALMQPDLQCDYEGTELEEFIGGVFEGSLVLDSVYVEYLLLDTIETYLPGCPDPVDIDIVLERSYMIDAFNLVSESTYDRITGTLLLLNHYRHFSMSFYDNGTYNIGLQDNEVAAITQFGSVSGWEHENLNAIPIPFPSSWGINDDGIQVTWNHVDWIAHCQYFRLIPFWHEAE